ncbi:MAG: PD40 domain-containing protein [Nocardioidaceae bacterium]|nr:PD40 domain-containing protein [Nocardioidaceae bacterium]
MTRTRSTTSRTRRTTSAALTLLAAAALNLPAPAPAAPATEGRQTEQSIAFSRYDPDIDGFALWTAKANGSRERRLTAGQAYFPAWSPDRSHLLFDFPDDSGDEQIGRIDADGSDFRQLTDLPGISEVADYSPDGSRIVFDRFVPRPDTPFFTSLWVMDADGRNPQPLFGEDSTTFDVEPEYSPDGSKIVFGRIDPVTEREALFVVGADGSRPRQITPYAAGLEHPRWSPDGRWVIYDIDAQGPKDGLYLVRPDGRDRHVLFQSKKLVAFKPDFSPNGRRILFGCFVRAQEQEDLCVVQADGSGLHRVVRTPGTWENFPVWG